MNLQFIGTVLIVKVTLCINKNRKYLICVSKTMEYNIQKLEPDLEPWLEHDLLPKLVPDLKLEPTVNPKLEPKQEGSTKPQGGMSSFMNRLSHFLKFKLVCIVYRM